MAPRLRIAPTTSSIVRHRDADVLEPDVRHSQVADLIDETAGVLDGPVVSGEHEYEVHRCSRDTRACGVHPQCWQSNICVGECNIGPRADQAPQSKTAAESAGGRRQAGSIAWIALRVKAKADDPRRAQNARPHASRRKQPAA